jgi:hypothetical protein
MRCQGATVRFDRSFQVLQYQQTPHGFGVTQRGPTTNGACGFMV